MARFSGSTPWSYPGHSQDAAAPADFSEPPSASVPGGTFSSSFFPVSLGFRNQVGRQPPAAAGVPSSGPERTGEGRRSSPAMPWPSFFPPRHVSRVAAFEHAAAPGTADAQAASSKAFSALPQSHQYDQAPLNAGIPPVFTDFPPSYTAAVNEGVERRIQTQRPLRRAHPYGSSLFGRLLNKISSSLSALVPRSSAVSCTTDAGAAPADASSTASTAEATSRQLLYSRPLQQPICGNVYPANAMLDTYSLRRSINLAGGATSTAVSVAPGTPLPVEYTDIEKNTQPLGEGIAPVNTREICWLSGQQVTRPHNHSYQTHPVIDHDANAVPVGPRNMFPGQAFPLSVETEQQLQFHHQLPPLRQQQQLWRLQQHTDGDKEEARDGADFNVAVGKCGKEHMHVAVSSDAWEEGGEQCPSSSVSAATAVPSRTTGAIPKERVRERKEAGTAGLETSSYHFDYGPPRQPVLAESLFASVTSGNTAVDGDNRELYGDTFRVQSAAVQQRKQQQDMLLDRSADGIMGISQTEAELPESCLSYYGILPNLPSQGVTRRREFCRNGGLLSSNNAVPSSLTQQQPYLTSEQVVPEKASSTEFLLQKSKSRIDSSPVKRGYLGPPPEWSQQEIISDSERIFSSGVQEEPGGSFSRMSSNSLLYPVAEDEGSTQVRRRPLQRGWGGAGSSLFSQTLAPAWLSTTAGGDPLEAEGRSGEREGPTATEAAPATSQVGSGISAGRAPRRPSGRGESAKTGTSTARSISSDTSIFPYSRQEQLTVEQLQKLYLRCQPLRWRVRLRDLLRQEAAVAAAAEKKTRAHLLKEKDAAGASSRSSNSTVVSPSAATDEDGRGVMEKKPGGMEGKQPDSSSRTQTAGKNASEDTAEGGSSVEVTDEASRSGSRNTGSTDAMTAEKEQRYGNGSGANSAKASSGSLFCPSNDVVQQATISTAQGRRDTRQEEEEKSKDHQATHALKGVSAETDRTSTGSSSIGMVGVHEQENRATTTRGGSTERGVETNPAGSLTGAADSSKEEGGGGKRSKVSSDKAATEGESGIHRSLFAADSSVLSTGREGINSGTSLFGGSSKSVFGSERTAPVAAGDAEAAKPEGGAAGEKGSISNSSQRATGEERGMSLFGKSLVSKEGGAAGSLPAPLFGGSMFTGLTTTGTAQQFQQQDSRSGGSTGKTGVTPVSSTPASSLFGGARSATSAAQQQVQQPAAAGQVSKNLSQAEQKPKQVANEQPLREEAAGGLNASERDAKKVTGDSAVTEKPAEQTSALPWWQQNLNKPCTVMPEEDFAPEADDEEEAGEAKAGGDTEKELPPLKVPNIFGNNSSTGGLFGSAGTNAPSFSIFKDAAAASSQPSVSSSTSGASTTPTAAVPSLFGSAASGTSLWNQNSSSSSGVSLFGSSVKPPAAPPTVAPAGSLFGGLDFSKQSSSQLSSVNTGAPTSLFGGTGGSGGTAGEQQQTTSLSGSTATGNTSIFATQKTSASLFGGSIFGNPVTSQTTNTSQQGAATSSAPAAGAGLFVFGASGGTKTPSPPASTATAVPGGQTVKGTGAPAAVPGLFGSSLQQQGQQASGGTGKRGRDAADGGSATALPAGKTIFGSLPPSGGGLGVFGQRTGTGGSTLFGGITPPSGSSLFSTSSSTTTGILAGQTDGNVGGRGSTGLGGSGSLLGDKSNNSTTTPGSLFGAARSATPVFGNSSSISNKDVANNPASVPATGGGSAASAATSSSIGLFGSSSNNNPFGFGGSSGSGGVSLFGSNATKPFDSSRPATTEGSLTATAQPFWSANKGSSTTQSLFSVPGNSALGPGAGTSRIDAGASAGGTPNGVLQPQRSLFGGAFGGNATGGGPGTPAPGNTTTMQGGPGTASNSLFGNVPPSFTFGATPATATGLPQQQQQQTGGVITGAPPAAAAAGGPDPGNAANAFFGAPSSGVRRPRLTIKRSKQ